MVSMFNEAKTAHMAAYLLRKAGGRMNYTKLLKLLYLADRESMKQTGDAMTDDQFFSLHHGPVLSQTMDLCRGEKKGSIWSTLLVKRGQYGVALVETETGRAATDDLDELSRRDRTILNQIFAQFGSMTWQQLVDWTHDHCSEWKDPGQSSIPIESQNIFEALGWSQPQARQMAHAFDERRQLESVLARFR